MKSSERKKKCKKSETDNSDLSESYRLGSKSSRRGYTFDHDGSLAEVKRDLTTMLDTMGPDTPQFQTTSSEADNDTSVVSTSSIIEHQRKADHSDPPTISQESIISQGTTTCSSETKNTSVLVELPSSQDGRVDEIEDLCDRAMYEVRSCLNTAHMQHSYMANQYANSEPYGMANNLQSNYLPAYYQEGDGFMKKRRSILEWFGLKPTLSPKTDLYKVKIKQEYPNTLPKQLTFERADGVPRSPLPFGVTHYPGIQGSQPVGLGYQTTEQIGENPALPPPWQCTNPVPHCNRYEEHCTMCEMYGSDPHAIHSLNYCRSSFVPTCSDYSCPYLETNTEPHINPEQRCSPNQTTRPYNNTHLVYHTPEMSHSAPVTNKDHKYTADQRSASYNGRLHSTKSTRQNCSASSSPRKDDRPTRDVDLHLKTESANSNCNTSFKNSPVKSASGRCNKINCACHTVQSVMEFGKESTGFGNPVGDGLGNPVGNDSEDRVNNLMHVGNGGMDQHNVTYYDTSGATRVDVYYFDHGNSGYYRTTDWAPHISSEVIARKTEIYTSKFWAEIFGTIHIGFSFCTSFILQFMRFILYSLMRPLVIGIVQLGSDYFFKPSLSICFNSVIQPFLIFLYNIASSIRDLCDPLAAGLGYYIREVAVFVRSFRIIEINHVTKAKTPTCNVCNQKGTPEEVRAETSR